MRRRLDTYLADLDRACALFGVTQGRAAEYRALVAAYFDRDTRTPEQILGCNESMEVHDLYQFWAARLHEFPGLREHIAASISKGPILTEQENPARSSNRPRNTSSVFVIAGMLLRSGLDVVCVEGTRKEGSECHTDADITVRAAGKLVDVQAKRPQSQQRLGDRSREAVKQITRSGRPGQLGIVAIDASAFLRPRLKLLEESDATRAYDRISRELQTRVAPIVQAHLTPEVCGYLVLARVPTMIEEASPILTATGRPFVYVTPFSITAAIAVENSECVDPGAAQIIRRLHTEPETTP